MYLDELNLIVPYSPLGMREARELMFMTYHMASIGTSSLLIGYHQDVSLGSHILTMYGTIVDPELWEEVARQVYDLRWKGKYSTYDRWFTSFMKRCERHNVGRYTGRCLYSTLLPEDMQWSSGDARIRDGILLDGTLTKSLASGSPSSIGMVMYRTYGADECVDWLNASYNAMNTYLVRTGLTLGISHIELPAELQAMIDTEINTSLRDPSLEFDSNKIADPVMRERKEAEILQDVNNVRERIAKIVIDYLTNIHKVLPEPGSIIRLIGTDSLDIDVPDYDPEDATGNDKVTINLYDGFVEYKGIKYSMGIYPTVEISQMSRVETTTGARWISDERSYTYKFPHPLLVMVKSGARGNETNAIQISGIIGQQSYANGRIPRMMSGGSRSMPCYQFGENTPESRGQITSSYKRGMSPADYAAAHVASRENLTSNTDLTPRTGYLGRRLRVFMENLRISRNQGRQLVTNERGVVIMWDFIMNPAFMFKVQNRTTFIDLDYEMRNISRKTTRDAIYMHIPFLPTMREYLAVDRRIDQILKLYPNRDIILALDGKIEITHPDVYSYLSNDLDKRVTTITLPDSLSENKKKYWYMALEEYEQVIPLPVTRGYKTAINSPGSGTYISINSASMYGISYIAESGKSINVNTLYQMLIMGSDFENYPMIVEPNEALYNMLDNHSFLEVLIIGGNVNAL